jgi:hypothetical protein
VGAPCSAERGVLPWAPLALRKEASFRGHPFLCGKRGVPAWASPTLRKERRPCVCVPDSAERGASLRRRPHLCGKRGVTPWAPLPPRKEGRPCVGAHTSAETGAPTEGRPYNWTTAIASISIRNPSCANVSTPNQVVAGRFSCCLKLICKASPIMAASAGW